MFDRFFKKKVKFIPKRYVIFNVDTFNVWFNSGDNESGYVNSGIFLRLDKLSESMIEDYLTQCHGLNLSEWNIGLEIINFQSEIKKDWLKKLQINDWLRPITK